MIRTHSLSARPPRFSLIFSRTDGARPFVCCRIFFFLFFRNAMRLWVVDLCRENLSRDASNASTPRQIFDLFDYRNQGVFSKEDLLHVLKTELGPQVEEMCAISQTCIELGSCSAV